MRLIRSALLWASTNPTLSEKLPRMAFVRRAARRFMPGEEAEDALREGRKLQEKGIPSLVTLLGENVDDDAASWEVADEYVALLGKIRDAGIDMELSVKPTQLGLDLGMDVCVENCRRILRACAGPDGAGDPGRADPAPGTVMMWIDMESSPYVDPTLELFRTLREEFPHVGLCLQAYLYRTATDVEKLLPLKPAIRLVKGAYREPDEVAFPLKADVDRSFVDLSAVLLEARKEGRAGRPGLGTHDRAIIADACEMADEEGLDRGAWEVEMLYGIEVGEQDRLRREGYGIRVLISYGSHWFPWYMRRLAERPANVWFVVRKMLGM